MPLPTRLAAVLLALLLLAGCGNTFLYNRLDWLIGWYVDDYVELSRAQEKVFQQRLRPVLDWHRREELVLYAALLRQIEADSAASLDADTVRDWSRQLLLALERIETRLWPLIHEIGADLDQAQMAELFENIRARQRELEEEYLTRTDEEYAEDNFDRLSENLRDFLGPLSAAQEDQIARAAQAMRRLDQAWLEERRLWLKTLQRLSARQPGWQAALRAAWAQRKERRTPRYHAHRRHNMDIIHALVAAVLNARSERQDRHLQRELGALQDDLQTLIGQARTASPRS